LYFADNIDLMGGSNQELQALTNSLVDRAGAYGMEVSTEKSKVMVNSTNNSSANIIMNGKILQEVASFKYLSATLSKDGSSTAEVSRWIAAASATMARLIRIYKSGISFITKHRLNRSLVVSILLYC